MDNDKHNYFTAHNIALGAGAVVVGGTLGFLGMRYRVCNPEQVMIRTGFGIKDMTVSKKGIQWPFQKHFMVSMVPKTYSFDLHNMSKEKVEFKLPVTFTTAPIHPSDDEVGFKKYAKFMNDIDPNDFTKTLGGMIEGEMRVHTATMTIEDMFSNKEKFQEEIVVKIGVDLDKIGIRILNANIKEMSDFDEHNKFFQYRKQRAIESANYDAQRDVAEAQKKGEIGMKFQENERRIEVAKLDKDSIAAENARKAEIAESEAELGEAEATSKKRKDIANVEADVAAREREIELERELYIKKQEQEIEKQRSIALIQAKVNAESLIEDSKGKSESIQLLADASFYQKQKEADGIKAVYEAQADGLHKLLKSAGNNSSLVQFYMALDKGLYPELAKHGAEAVKGMKPDIKVWNTGSNPSDPMKPIIQAVQSMSPLLQGVQDQGGMILPDWMPKVGTNNEQSNGIKQN